MNRETKRRAFLGGLATVGVGGTGYLLSRSGADAQDDQGTETDSGRWLRPVDPLADSTTFAYVGGRRERDGDDRLEVEVAMRDRTEDGRGIELFAGGDNPAEEYLPPLRSFWRFDVRTDGRDPGEYALAVGDETLPVELVAEAPPGADARVALTPRTTWRSDYVAHARGYSTGDGGGRLDVAFRRRTGDPPVLDGVGFRDGSLDAVGFRDPEGRLLGRRSVPAGVRELSFEVSDLRAFDADGELVVFQDGREADTVTMFYH